jgi:GNAT superfamily N-acetyltransferase
MNVTIQPFTMAQWPDLWQIRHAHLIENGIAETTIQTPSSPSASSGYDTDLHAIDKVYLSGKGGFWLAYVNDIPVGYVGLQDLGDTGELRRMYVNRSYRRRGIGQALCQALIEHARQAGMHEVELWTAGDRPGQRLYEMLGFEEIILADADRQRIGMMTQREPNEDEIRMLLKL